MRRLGLPPSVMRDAPAATASLSSSASDGSVLMREQTDQKRANDFHEI